jgi:hypothetical protein
MSSNSFHKSVSFLMAVVFILFLLPAPVTADGLSERRAWVGLDLFPTFLAADDHINEKKGEDGRLHLLLVYKERRGLAEEMAGQLSRIRAIRSIPVQVSEVMIDDLENTPGDTPAGLFLVERMGDRLGTAIQFGQERHIIVFSPFPGDVEKGVNSGMVISDRILPYVNVEAMHLSGVYMKSFFFRIAERYGE